MQPKENGCLIHREAGDRKTRTQEDEERARKRRTEASPLLGGSESTPYLWQFTEADYHTWKNFGPSDNVVLEVFSYDVNNVEIEIELEDTRIRQSGTLSGKMSVNFQTMSMSLISSFDQFLIRRCSIQELNNKLEDIDGWKKYAEKKLCSGKRQEQMEASYLNEDPAYHIQIGRNDYTINFEGIPMNQRSADSEVARLVSERPMFEGTLMNQRSADPEVQAARLVRGRPMFEGTPMNQRSADPDVQAACFVSRRPMFASKSAPQTTVTNPKGQVMTIERTKLKKDSEEYRTVSQRFRETMPRRQASILMVEKITNDHLLQKYKRKRQEMREQLKPRSEKLLFHGTTSDVVDAICTRNFDHRVCGKNGTKYGQGSYFAVDASYSNNYSNNYSKTEGDETRYMFLAKVLTGEFIRGKKDFRRPPLKDPSNLAGDLYDSCVDDENQPKIFVIFDNEQCYPSYLIKYYLK